MIRRARRLLAAGAIVLGATTACGVSPERDPEPLPPTTPVVLPPSVTQEPVPATPSPPPSPSPVLPVPGATGS
ncbi:hypothetical protein GCM10023203_34020 [Actinomycetospora straminea]|uniref:Uncharacterized protein n=1 Tax=Actinomycetospora straminea TaxID=663607 RepID=A0ABP9ELF3_9PSEU